jgi:hypothetical protein
MITFIDSDVLILGCAFPLWPRCKHQ